MLKGGNEMYAIVLTGGKQYKVSEGDQINVEKLNAKVGDKVKLDVLITKSACFKIQSKKEN